MAAARNGAKARGPRDLSPAGCSTTATAPGAIQPASAGAVSAAPSSRASQWRVGKRDRCGDGGRRPGWRDCRPEPPARVGRGRENERTPRRRAATPERQTRANSGASRPIRGQLPALRRAMEMHDIAELEGAAAARKARLTRQAGQLRDAFNQPGREFSISRLPRQRRLRRRIARRRRRIVPTGTERAFYILVVKYAAHFNPSSLSNGRKSFIEGTAYFV